MNPKYLVRPPDYCLFELDEKTQCYKGYGTPTEPYFHFTYDNLVNNYGYHSIEEGEISLYEEKSHKYFDSLKRSNSHE